MPYLTKYCVELSQLTLKTSWNGDISAQDKTVVVDDEGLGTGDTLGCSNNDDAAEVDNKEDRRRSGTEDGIWEEDEYDGDNLSKGTDVTD